MADQAPNIYPALQYADAEAALDWLARAFGFQEYVVYRSDQGKIQHAEMSLGPGMIMFGQGERELPRLLERDHQASSGGSPTFGQYVPKLHTFPSGSLHVYSREP